MRSLGNRLIFLMPVVLTGVAVSGFIGTGSLQGQVEPEIPSALSAVETVAHQIQDSVIRLESFGGSAGAASSRTSQFFTGTALGAPGLIVTAAIHLEHQPEVIVARLPNGQRANATIAGRNPARQIVLLQIETDRPPPPLTLATRIHQGQTAIAVGKVFDPAIANLSTGIVSATGRIAGRAIQTDAAVSANNYGGPLVDLDGHVLGILVPMSPASERPGAGREWYDSGIGFAVPVTGQELSRMAAGQTLKPGKTGISFREDRGFASQPVVAAVAINSPAARAGLVADDRIRSINGLPVELLSDARIRLGPLYAGDSVAFEVQREDQILNLELILAESIEVWRPGMLGVRVDSQSADQPGVPVRQVAETGPAAEAGLQAGDQITAIDGNPVTTRAALAELLATRPANNEMELTWIHNGQTNQRVVSLAPLTAVPWESEPGVPAADRRPRELRLPDADVPGMLYQPPNSDSCNLLVWLTRNDVGGVESEIEKCLDLADRFCVAVLIVPPTDIGGWRGDEIDRITGLTRQAMNILNADRWQVAVGGRTVAGRMASRVALHTAPLYRGLVLIDSNLDPQVVDQVATPSTNQLIAWLQTGVQPFQGNDLEGPVLRLEENGFPVWQESVTGDYLPESVFRWMASLDRL